MNSPLLRQRCDDCRKRKMGCRQFIGFEPFRTPLMSLCPRCYSWWTHERPFCKSLGGKEQVKA